MLKVAVLVSGSGSNLQSILDYGQASFKVEMVIGSKEGIYALERAKNKNIPTYVVSKEEYGSEISNKILELTKNRVDLIVLAGYLSILDCDILKEFKDMNFESDLDCIVDFDNMTCQINELRIGISEKGVKKVKEVKIGEEEKDVKEEDIIQKELKDFLSDELEISKVKIVVYYL